MLNCSEYAKVFLSVLKGGLHPYCLISNREGLFIHIVIKRRPSFTKSPSLVLIRLVFTEVKPFENVKIYSEMYMAARTLSDPVSGWPYISFKQ